MREDAAWQAGNLDLRAEMEIHTTSQTMRTERAGVEGVVVGKGLRGRFLTKRSEYFMYLFSHQPISVADFSRRVNDTERSIHLKKSEFLNFQSFFFFWSRGGGECHDLQKLWGLLAQRYKFTPQNNSGV